YRCGNDWFNGWREPDTNQSVASWTLGFTCHGLTRPTTAARTTSVSADRTEFRKPRVRSCGPTATLRVSGFLGVYYARKRCNARVRLLGLLSVKLATAGGNLVSKAGLWGEIRSGTKRNSG